MTGVVPQKQAPCHLPCSNALTAYKIRVLGAACCPVGAEHVYTEVGGSIVSAARKKLGDRGLCYCSRGSANLTVDRLFIVVFGYSLPPRVMIEGAAGPWNVLDHGVRKISTLDFDLAVEMAVVATGLLAATQVGACSRAE